MELVAKKEVVAEEVAETEEEEEETEDGDEEEDGEGLALSCPGDKVLALPLRGGGEEVWASGPSLVVALTGPSGMETLWQHTQKYI